ncbi:MAG: phosphate ABC transporter permease subunit PstC [Deltaproteobacteria bacterium]|jgi:phosphate transport system permease protein|nr:phosphate ABC transporter permease subunit PstC [Deltaproteobacteria bacterium]
MTPGSARKEQIIRLMLAGVAGCSLLFLALIMVFLFMEGLPVFRQLPVTDFLFGMEWRPTAEYPEFGIFPLIAGSAAVTLVASSLAIPLGVMTAVWLTEIAPSTLRRIFKPVIELLAALPSVVVGFFGMAVVAPRTQTFFDLDTGLNLFNAGLMLAFMSVPTICSVAEDALHSVPVSLREASLALGATRWETIIRVVIPAAFSGIGTACMLGMSRSIGETMVVLMVAGGAGIIPSSLFDPIRPMPAAIAAEIAEAPFRGEHYHALFAIGMVLFLFTLAFNLVARRITEKNRLTLN